MEPGQYLRPIKDPRRIAEPGRLAPVHVQRPDRGARKPAQGAFVWALWSVILLYILPSNLLFQFGIDYDGAGGDPLSKIRPATYIALIGAIVAILNRRRARLLALARVPLTTAFMATTVCCAIFAMISIGATSVSNYVDTFLAAGFLTYALADSTPQQRRTLGYVIMGLTLLSIAISLAEDYTHVHFIPVHIAGGFNPKKILGKGIDAFRGAGLYSDPLMGSTISAMAVFLLIAMRLPLVTSGFALFLLLAGLLSFGGRAALGVTLLVLLVVGIAFLGSRLLQRRLTAKVLGAGLAVVIVFPPLFGVLVSQTDLGARILDHLYMDDSARVRAYQWEVLDKLNPRDVLFGTTRTDLEVMKSQIGISGRGDDIENPWLLLFLNFGLIGFLPFVAGLAGFFLENSRRGGWPAGWLLIGSYLAISFTNNSFGEKVSDFSFLVAFTYAMSGFAEQVPVIQSRRSITRAPLPRRQPAMALGTMSGLPRGLRPTPKAGRVAMLSLHPRR